MGKIRLTGIARKFDVSIKQVSLWKELGLICVDKPWILEEKSKTAEKIHELLIEKIKHHKDSCSVCGCEMWNNFHSMCNNCYEDMTFYR